MSRKFFALILLVFFYRAFPCVADAEKKYDLLLMGGEIVDGTGGPKKVADVGIRGDKIIAIGKLNKEDAKRTIDAKGYTVAPGFVDMMGQSASAMLENPKEALNLLKQGITSINAGEGASAAPLSDVKAKQYGWQTMQEYFLLLEMRGLPINVAQTIGHTQVREIALGDANRRPSDEELNRMCELVQEAMDAGAIGVSTALIYPPAVYANTDEIAALAEVAGKSGGRYYTHMRNEGDLLLEAIDEALEIGEKAGAPVHIFHLKAAGKQNWPKMAQAIEKIKKARSNGRQVSADIYPYINNGLGIAALIHPRHFSAGRGKFLRRLGDKKLQAEIRKEMETTDGWENWFRHVGHDWGKVVIGSSNGPRFAKYAGKTVAEIAKDRGKDPWDIFFSLVRAEAFALPESMTDKNVQLGLGEDFISVCTDVGPASRSKRSRSSSHPRGFGAFSRLLAHYVRDKKVLSLEKAVAKASAKGAEAIMAKDRGIIAEGKAADVIVFKLDEIEENATFSNPRRYSGGMKHVIVNGQLVLEDGQLTKNLPGRVLRGPGYKPHLSISSGASTPQTQEIDRIVEDYLKKASAPGMAIAITQNSKLVFAKGYGYADLRTGEKVTPESRFRIASISKPITAVAIMQLVDQGKLKLQDRVFDILDYKPYLPMFAKFDERQKEITIEHLLQHRGGWDRSVSFDAMFRTVQFAKMLKEEPPAKPATVIRVMLGKKLDFDPGERYAYSNYGYCLLGRVIEKLTGKSYEAYVQESVLKPIGAKRMAIGESLIEGRKKNEVRYYDPYSGKSVFAKNFRERVPSPYGNWYLEAMDAHGAWISSAVDLARFACALDKGKENGLLSEEAMKAMHKRPLGLAGYEKNGKPKPTFYGFGWSITTRGKKQISARHGGSLPGTSTILLRQANGLNIVLLFNSRINPQMKNQSRAAIDKLLPAIGRMKFDDKDLFKEYK